MSDEAVKVRLVFVDRGAYHVADVTIPGASLEAYDRLIDCVREDSAVLKQLHVDVARLCAAYVVEAG
jgi:hypothetical protein